MKLSFLLTCVSFLLFVQLINSEKDQTFSKFLEKFNKKASKKGITMGSNLNFIVQISKTIDKLKKKLETPAKEFMDGKKMSEVIIRIPAHLKITVYDPIETNAREFILNAIRSINKAQTVRIPNANKEVSTEIAFKPSINYDKVIDKWSEIWDQDPFTAQHMRQVSDESKDMTTEFEILLNRFNEIMKALQASEAGIQNGLDSVQSEFTRLLKIDVKKPNANQAEAIIVGLQPILDKLFQQQNQAIEHLQALKNVLIDYNKDRSRWVEFLLTMRESHTSQRKTGNFILNIVTKFASKQ